MLRPDSRDFFVRSKLATQNLGVSFGKVSLFLCGQLDRWLIYTGKLQQDTGKFVLHVVGKSGNRFDGLFKQSGHLRNIVDLGLLGRLASAIRPHGFPIAIAMAAATNGNGSDTAARNQTKRAGMNGISHRISRWKANSAQAIT